MTPVPGPAWLFCPADRPDRYEKALRAADGVILDLEDAVAPDRKDAARRDLVAHPLDPSRVVVRVNDARSPEHAADLAALRDTPYRTVMLAKAERPADLDLLGDAAVVGLCETPAGVLGAPALAADNRIVALMWGAEDLVAAMNGRSSRHPDGRYRDFARYARSAVLLAASAHGRTAIDAVYTAIGDLDGLSAESEDAAAVGFKVKACIHPNQVPVVRAAFRPSDGEVTWARRVLAAAESTGVTSVDGQMIDEPLVRQARAVLAAAAQPETP